MNKLPKECVHTTCNKVLYVARYQLHLPLMCESCTEVKQLNTLQDGNI